MDKNKIALFLVGISVLVAVFPLLHHGLPPTHDGEYHIIRFYEFYKTLSSGVIYPRWAQDLNWGYGVPLFSFVYPFPNYVAAFLHSIGFSFIDAFKYNFLLATLIGSFSFYFFAKYHFGWLGGVVGAVFYTFAPYRFVDIYIRGSVGEVWSLAFIPALLWSLTNLIVRRDMRYMPISSVIFALLIFSHNILAVLLLPFLFFYALFLAISKKDIRRFWTSLLAFAGGIGLSSIFWLPALLEKQYVRGLEVYDYKAYFPDLVSLLFPSWGTGFIGGGSTNPMSTQVGVANLLVVALCIVFLKRTISQKRYLTIFFLIVFIITFLIMLPFSSSLWAVLPLFHFVQFPWRYLSLVLVTCSFLSASLVTLVKHRYLTATALTLLAIFSTISYTKPAYYHDRIDEYYISRDNFIHGTNSPGNAFNTVWIDKPLPMVSRVAEVASGSGNLDVIQETPERYRFASTLTSPSVVSMHVAYFPGWSATEEGKSLPLQRNNTGYMELALPEGQHFITLQFTDTIVRMVSGFISIATGVLIAASGIISVKLRK